MKALAIFLAGVLTIQAASQTVPAARTQMAAAHSPGVGAANTPASSIFLFAKLSKPLDTRKSKANDRIEVRTSTGLFYRGRVLLPRNTKIFGHVTEAKAHTKTSPDSLLGVIFDRIRMKDGREFPFRATIQAIGKPLQFASKPLEGANPSLENQIPVDAPIAHTPSNANPGVVRSRRGEPDPASDPLKIPSTIIPLNPTDRGVIGIDAITLQSSELVSVLTSSSQNIHLYAGTQLVLHIK